MLTSDLLRVRRRKGRITPQYLKIDNEEAMGRATALVEIFESHRGKARGIIDEKVERAIGHGTDFLIWRGLAKLLYDRSEFAVDAAAKPERVREVVFELAVAAGNPSDEEGRRQVLKQAAEILDVDADSCDVALYADLEERQVLEEFKSLGPQELLQRYNVALAQAVLYRARKMSIELAVQDSNKLRLLFQMLKFHRLMHRTRREEEGYVIEVDGPCSIFKRGRKYGVQMAKFLPALLHLSGWTVRADIEWEDEVYKFELDETAGLVPSGRARGQWIAEEERWFEQRFKEIGPTGWELERRGEIVELSDNEVLVTDYVVRTDTGAQVLLEIVGFWRLAYLRRRLQWLRDIDPEPPVVLVVSERLKTDREALEETSAQVVFFKGVILVQKIEAAVREALNIGPDKGST